MYLQGSYTIEQIARTTGVSTKTIGNWKEAGKWEELKASENSTQDMILNHINKGLLILMEENEGRGIITNIKEITRLVKIKETMSNKLPLQHYMTVFREFNDFLKSEGELKLAKEINPLQTSFIQSKL